MKYSIKIQGGLGNQLFQWAHGVFLANRGAQVYYDVSFYEKKNGSETIPHRNFCLDKILQNIIYRKNCNEIKEIKGYWQKENKIELLRDNIISKVKPCPIKTKKDSCSIHIRRGDYLRLNQIYHNLNKDYFMNSLEKINPSGIIYIFSDDIHWCKDNLNIKNAIFSENKTEIEDFQLMRSCNHNIICNSTFSWWAAWLNNNHNKKIIQPKLWFKKQSQGNLLNPNWIAI